MKKRTAMLARIERIEQRRFIPPRRRVVSEISGRSDEQITGYSTMDGVTVHRLPQEALEPLRARTFAVTDAQFIYAIYAAPETATERDEADGWHSGPS